MPQLRIFSMVGRYFLIPGITSLVILFAFPLDANAKTTISVVDGYSTLDTTTSTTPAAYGGTAGLDCSGGDSVCSNCNVAFGSTCNTRRMNPALILRITVSSDTIATGNVQIWGPASTTSPLTSNAVPAIIAKGATSTLSILWSDLCGAITGSNTACNTVGTFSGTFNVGLDSDGNGTADESTPIKIAVMSGPALGIGASCGTAAAGQGLCYFEVISGDKKAELSKLEGASGFPGTGDHVKVRVCKGDRLSLDMNGNGAWDEMNLSNCSEGDDLPIVSGSPPTVDPKRVKGLTNERVYDFILGVVDRAGNAGSFTSAGDAAGDCADPIGSMGPDGWLECKTARPSEVVGILNEEINCFVATAAYGSPMASQVTTLRRFRTKFLQTSEFGRSFIKFYYVEGAKLAKFISKSEALRTISRALIYPVLIFATIALQYGGVTALGICFAGVALLVGFFALARRFSRRISA